MYVCLFSNYADNLLAVDGDFCVYFLFLFFYVFFIFVFIKTPSVGKTII